MSHVDIVRYQDGRYGILPANAGCYEGSSEIIRGLGLSNELRELVDDIEPEAIVNAIQGVHDTCVVYSDREYSDTKLFYKTSLEKHLVLKFSPINNYMDTTIKDVYVPKFVFSWKQILALMVYIGIFMFLWSIIRKDKDPKFGILFVGFILILISVCLSYRVYKGDYLSNPFNLFWLLLLIHCIVSLNEVLRRRKIPSQFNDYLE